MEVWRDGALVVTTPNDGLHIDDTLTKKGRGQYVYQVCEVATAVCSAEVVADYN